ncbi:hypothetical protein AC579_6937 [Pseudocercospora musae]|uniref:Redoxin domain-containing protein n=1 Tax=Pseudocercospora musae TaxID=113226 RepID=A0A139INP5_9PEZI|nr:hypothetical protein AC579_6937 [Pseudocercospora musae]
MAHTTFPADIPKPIDDGACNHLPDTKFPSISLPSTSGSLTDISTVTCLTILFCYPRTASPNELVPRLMEPDPWRSRLHTTSLFVPRSLKGTISGKYQRELRERTKLPYQLLSDEEGGLRKGLWLPTMEWEGKRLIKRLSMVVEDRVILKVFYPVFPPDRSAGQVLEWLRNEYRGRKTLSTEAENETMENLQEKR